MDTCLIPFSRPRCNLNTVSLSFVVGISHAKDQVKFFKKHAPVLRICWMKAAIEAVYHTLWSTLWLFQLMELKPHQFLLFLMILWTWKTFIHRVRGVEVGAVVVAKGCVVFCKTRWCNLQFFIWFQPEILAPFIGHIIKLEEASVDTPTWYHMGYKEFIRLCKMYWINPMSLSYIPLAIANQSELQ